MNPYLTAAEIIGRTNDPRAAELVTWLRQAGQTVLDLRPRPSPTNPYREVAEVLRAAGTDRGRDLAAWCDELATARPTTHADPLLLAAAARSAVDGPARRWLTAELAALDEIIRTRG